MRRSPRVRSGVGVCVFTIRPRSWSGPEPGSRPHTVSIAAPGVILAVRVSVTLTWRIAASERVPGAVAVIRASLPHRGTTRPKQTLVAWRSARTEGNAISEGRYFGTMLNDTTCRRAAIGGSFAAPPGMAAQAKS